VFVFEVAVDPLFSFLSGEYAELFACSRATAFQHPKWLDAVYRKLLPRKAAPLVVTVRRAGRLAMVLPLVRRRYGTLRAIEFADFGVSDYASPVASDSDSAAILADRNACARIKDVLKPFDVLRIQKLREDSFPLERLVGAPPRVAMTMSAHAVALGADYDAWRAEKITASYRKELDKKSRQLHRKGAIAFACAADPAAIRTTLEKMKEYRGPRFGDGDLLQNPTYFDFYLDVATRGHGSLARLYSLTLDGEPIAGVLGLSHQGRLLVILGGFDLTNHKNQSLGSLTFAMVAQHCIEMGDIELDFTIGDEPYKSLFGAQATPVYQISRAGSVMGLVAGKAVEQLPWLKDVAKRVLHAGSSATPRSAGEAGRR
jgi:CelD/BcsL family acetyltransferase involved in cellulose biosynthesis